MEQKKLVEFGKTLFVLSLLFIFTGLFLEIDSKNSFSDPIKDTQLVADGGNKVIISTIDDDKDPIKNGDSNNNDSLPSDDSIDSPNDDGGGNEEISNDAPVTPPVQETPQKPVEQPKPEEKPATNPTPSEPPKQEEPPKTPEIPEEKPGNGSSNNETEQPAVPTIEETNNALRKQIEDTYGIVVKYGSEINGYFVGGMKTVPIADANISKQGLEQLNASLALYPQNFFREFENSYFKLRIYLVQKYSIDNVTGVTELNNNLVTISISMDYSFAESFHHEVYHYIEHLIERKGGEFSIWNTFNPADFMYGGAANSQLSYNRTWNPTAPFVNNYAQTDGDEDRASTFEYMTATNRATCFNSSEYPIWRKSSYMALMIDTYFDSVDSSVIEYWERFIY